MRCRRLLPLLAVLVGAAAPLSFADQVVYFANGKAIMVKSVEKGDKFTILEMEGGGRMGVPTDQIVKIEDYVVSVPALAAPVAPAPQVAAAPQAPPAAGGAAAGQPALPATGGQIGIPSGLPVAAPMVPGPGVGGRPAGGPNNNMAGLKPLEVGGDGSGAPQRPLPRANAVPGAGGPGAPMLGAATGRPNFSAGRRFGGRGGGPGRNVRPPELNRYVPPQPAVQSVAPVPPPADPAPAAEPEEPDPVPDDANEEATDPSTPEEGDSSGDTPGSAS